jgi:hypothetical protein
VVPQLREQLLARALVNRHRQTPIAFGSGAFNRRRQHLARNKGNHADMQMRGMPGRDRLHFPRQMVEIFGHRPCSRQHDLTQCRWRHAARRAVEQRRPEHVLQFRQRIGDRGLAARHVFGGARQRAVLLNLQQQREMAHFQPRCQLAHHHVGIECRHKSAMPLEKGDGGILTPNVVLMGRP